MITSSFSVKKAVIILSLLQKYYSFHMTDVFTVKNNGISGLVRDLCISQKPTAPEEAVGFIYVLDLLFYK